MAASGPYYSKWLCWHGDISSKKYSPIGQIHKVICNFSRVNCRTKIKLVKAYFTSFYWAELWDLSHTDIESVCRPTTWLSNIRCVWQVPSTIHMLHTSRPVIRCVWQVPSTNHAALIPGLCNTLHLLDIFYIVTYFVTRVNDAAF